MPSSSPPPASPTRQGREARSLSSQKMHNNRSQRQINRPGVAAMNTGTGGSRRRLNPTSSRRPSHRRASNIVMLTESMTRGPSIFQRSSTFANKLSATINESGGVSSMVEGIKNMKSIASLKSTPSFRTWGKGLGGMGKLDAQGDVKQILVIGPESSGKTLFLRSVARICEVCTTRRLKPKAFNQSTTLSHTQGSINPFSLVPLRMDTIPTTGVEFTNCVYNSNGVDFIFKEDDDIELPKKGKQNSSHRKSNSERRAANVSISLSFREVGSSLSQMWPTYFDRSDMILFVLDISNFSKMSETHCQLDHLFDTLKEGKKLKASERDSEIIEREKVREKKEHEKNTKKKERRGREFEGANLFLLLVSQSHFLSHRPSHLLAFTRLAAKTSMYYPKQIRPLFDTYTIPNHRFSPALLIM